MQYSDIHEFGQAFTSTNIHHFNLLMQIKTLMGARASRPWGKRLLRWLDRLDRRILTRAPCLNKYCGKVVVDYCNPRPGGARHQA